jgi:hypothetical protein
MGLDSGLSNALLQTGVAGVFIIILLYAVYALWKDNKQLRADNVALLEARRQDAKENLDLVVKPMAGISHTLDLIETKLLVSKGRQ